VRVLFIKLKNIGDALLLTPTLTAARARYPDAEIWVLVRKGTEGILAGCPAIDRLITSAPPEKRGRSLSNLLDDAHLLRTIREAQFDYAFDLGVGDRGRWFCALSRAKHRAAVLKGPMSPLWRFGFEHHLPRDVALAGKHRAEMDFCRVDGVLPLGDAMPPLCFARSRTTEWPGAAGVNDFVLIHPTTRWERKRWPGENWIQLGRELLKHVPNLIISSGPDGDEKIWARELAESLGANARHTGGDLEWSALAGLLCRARLFVGVDTAAMHLAAACQTPIVGLFGPSLSGEWSPWRAKHLLVTPDVHSGVPETELMAHISVPQVIAACEQMLAIDGVSK
jgi:heptosyltransferase-3